MKTVRWIRIGLTLALFAGSASCGDPATAPRHAGTLAVSLKTPNTDDGAVLLALFGPGVADVQPANSAYRVYSLIASPTEARFLVVGDLSTGPLLTFKVDDSGRIGEYHGTVLQAAARTDEVRTVSTDYELTFATR